MAERAWHDEHEDMRIRKLGSGWSRIWMEGWEMLGALANCTSLLVLIRAIRNVGRTNAVYMNWEREYQDICRKRTWNRCLRELRDMGMMLPVPKTKGLWMVNPKLFMFGDSRMRSMLISKWNALVDSWDEAEPDDFGEDADDVQEP